MKKISEPTPLKVRFAENVYLDALRLIITKIMLCANSGGGKSWLIRLFVEQVIGKIPTIILDCEGEFRTLREKYDFVLVGEGGEIPVSLATAAKLAKKLAEIRTSAVIDISDLSKADQRKFVRIFLGSLLAVPRKFWGPMFVILDEAQDFCSGDGPSCESRDIVLHFAAQSRKRGFCLIPATQRISKIHADLRGECNNQCFGRHAQDLDLRRVADILGLAGGKKEWAQIRDLKPGQFFAMGPAFEHTGVRLFTADQVKTTHVRPGQRQALEAPRPSREILKIIPELGDLQREVEAEASELDALRTEVKQLRAAAKRPAVAPARAAPPPPALKIDPAPYVLQGREDVCRMLSADLEAMGKTVAAARQAVTAMDKSLADAVRLLQQIRPKPAQLAKAVAITAKQATPPIPKGNGRATGIGAGWSAVLEKQPADGRGIRASSSGSGDSEVGGGGKRRMLIALVQQADIGATRSQLAILSGMSVTSGTFANYLSEFRRDGWIRDESKRIYATEAGVTALGDYQPLPVGSDLVRYWLDRVGQGGERRILEVLIDNPSGISRVDLASAAELSATSGTLANYLSKFRKLELIQGNAENLQVADTLLEAINS